MNFSKSEYNINLGTEYELRFGDTRLTLGRGFMSEGKKLPSMAGLVTPDLNKAGNTDGYSKKIFTVPSLDTPVCEWQIKRLSDSLAEHAGDSMIYFVVSVDTPFAQARFIKENAINPKIRFLSDYAGHRFMVETGLHITELNLFARAVIECDENDIVRCVTVPRDITQVPQ